MSDGIGNYCAEVYPATHDCADCLLLRKRIAELEAAIAAEREACAQIALSAPDRRNRNGTPVDAYDIAAAIRARGEK